MNIFRKIYCRSYQGVFRALLPFLPYREPKILKNYTELARILKEKKISNILLVTDKTIYSLGLTKGMEDKLCRYGINCCVYSDTVANPTTDNVDEALKMYKENNCTALVGLGGGSSIDCAKAVGALVVNENKTLNQMKGLLKVKKKLPLLVAIPTTAGTGSETTVASVIVDSKTRHKYAINDFVLIPDYALLDAKLTINLPPFVTATTGMDALTHAVEAYIGKSTTKDTRFESLFAIKLIFENLFEAYSNGKNNLEARQNMLLASYNAGLAFTKSYVGYVHAIAHSLGGKYNVAHGLANAVILPIMLKIYGKSVHKKLWKISVFLGLCDKSTSYENGAKEFISAIEELNRCMNIPTFIEELREEDIDELAFHADKEGNPLYPVPKLMNKKELKEIYYKLLKKD